MDEDQRALQQLTRIFVMIDEFSSRTSSRDTILRAEPGTVLALDDQQSNPFHGSHAAASALVVAVDHLQAIRRMTDGCPSCESTLMTFQVAAHWTLLRAALENACRAIWLLGPAERSERVLRALRVQADNVANSDAAAKLLNPNLVRPKGERIARVKGIASGAGLSPGKAVEPIRYAEIVGYAGNFIADLGDHVKFLWRACSGAAHGDAWAVLSLQERQALDIADGVSTQQLTVSIPALVLVASEVIEVVGMAFGLFDYRNQPVEDINMAEHT